MKEHKKSKIVTSIEESSQKIKEALHKQEVLHLNLGYITGLFAYSKYHSKLNISQLMASVIPALNHDQFKIFFRGFRPIAFVSWAMLSDEVANKYKKGDYFLTIEEWKSGNQVWLGEIITPYSEKDRDAVIKNLKEKVFLNKEVNILTRNEDGSVKEIIRNFEN